MSDTYLNLDNDENMGGTNPSKKRVPSQWSISHFISAKVTAVVTELKSYADSAVAALKSYVDTELAKKEDSANKSTSITSSSTNDTYPGSKAVYDLVKAQATGKIYRHNVTISCKFLLTTLSRTFDILSSDNTPFTKETLTSYFDNNGYNNSDNAVPCNRAAQGSVNGFISSSYESFSSSDNLQVVCSSSSLMSFVYHKNSKWYVTGGGATAGYSETNVSLTSDVVTQI